MGSNAIWPNSKRPGCGYSGSGYTDDIINIGPMSIWPNIKRIFTSIKPILSYKLGI
jgi:hypothetical protein